MAKIGGFSDKNFTEAVKLAQTAQKQAAAANDSADGIQTSLDGKITVGTTAPGNDQAAGHDKGDVWYVTDSAGVYTAQYYFDGVSWIAQKWDENTLSVKNLSALSSNLGYIQNGTLDSISIKSTTITGGKITGGTISGETIQGGTITGSAIDQDFTSSDGNHYQLWADYNGFHYRVTRGSDGMVQDMRMTDGGFTVKGSGTVPTVVAGDSVISNNIAGTNVTAVMNLKGNTVSGSSVSGNGLSISGHTIACSDGGALYLEKQGGGGSVTNIHAADVYSNGSKLKSALSAKRDVTDYSPDEALSAVMNTDVKKWRYKDSDNSVDSQHIGPIIDDVNDIGKKSASIANDMISMDEKGNYFLNESNTISILLAALKKSNQRIDELSYRIAQLERKNMQ